MVNYTNGLNVYTTVKNSYTNVFCFKYPGQRFNAGKQKSRLK